MVRTILLTISLFFSTILIPLQSPVQAVRGYETPEGLRTTGDYTKAFIHYLRTGMTEFPYTEGEYQQAHLSLSELVQDYLNIENIKYYDEGTKLSFEPEVIRRLQEESIKADKRWEDYQGYVKKAAGQFKNLPAPLQVELVNKFVTDNFSYEIIGTGHMPQFTETGIGQCYHYAILMADILTELGVDAWTEYDRTHMWMATRINGSTYRHDPTFNDSSSDRTEYLWMPRYRNSKNLLEKYV